MLREPPDLEPAAPAARPAPDRAPDRLAAGSPAAVRDGLVALLGEDRVLTSATDLVKYASDASPYRLIPKAVVVARDVDDVRKVFEYARRSGESVTFRSAGTSLSGQAQGDGVLVDVRRHWAGVTVEEDGRRLRARPGTVLFRANLALRPYGYRLGPDPASESACTIGGVVANNSSGMCCGTAQNAYRTLRSLAFMLPSGTFVDTAESGAEERFAAAEPDLARGVMEIKADLEARPDLVRRVREKYAVKNTSGYRMDAFLDGATPLEVFRRAVVGSEGTLAFVAEAVFETVPLNPFRLTTLLVFPELRAACAAVGPFVASGAAAVELMDRFSLRAVEGKPGVPPRWEALPEGAAALLVEYRVSDGAALERARAAARGVVDALELLEPPELTADPTLAARYWLVRNGLLTSIGGARPPGTSAILEDVCVRPERLADAAEDLSALLERHGYERAVFGHASAGNLHFMLTPSLNELDGVERYDRFMQELVRLVVDRYDGSLKAEHGTGRNMAPFLEREWGGEIVAMMRRLKRLADPSGLLSPGVVFDDNPRAHVEHLQTMPLVDPIADRCIECGFCEPVCPSRHLTTTPRQRIVLRREMARQPEGSPVLRALAGEYEYQAVETCAGDGTCAIACPVDIDTGEMMKRLRLEARSPLAERAAEAAARRWAAVERAARAALRAGHLAARVAGHRPVRALTAAARAVLGKEAVPLWLAETPEAASGRLPETAREGAEAVYFPACVNRVFGPEPRGPARPTLAEAVVAVSERAGAPVWIPPDVAGACCATVWHSKGFAAANALAANRLVERMWRWSGEGALPVVVDASSCAFGAASEIVPYLTAENAERHRRLEVVDAIVWAHDRLLPRLEVRRKVGSAAVHPTCAAAHLGLAPRLRAVAEALADEVVVPVVSTCCGFAGDRGMLHPELTEAATAEAAAEVRARPFDAYLSSNRTCEVGLSRATGASYRSFLYLLEELTRGPNTDPADP